MSPNDQIESTADPEWTGAAVYTIGHSTRPQDDFIGLLKQYGVATLADVRAIPQSRRNPQYNLDELAATLPQHGISYVHLAQLGGLRHGLDAASPNAGWRNASFRGYADYMQTEEFARIGSVASTDRRRSGRGDVRRGCSLALSSLVDRRRPAGPRRRHRGHPEPHQALASRDDPLRSRFRSTNYLPRTRAPAPKARLLSMEEGIRTSQCQRLAVGSPFNLQATVRLIQRRPNGVDHWERSRYLRAFETGQGTRLAIVVNDGTVDAPDVRLQIAGGSVDDETTRAAATTLRWVLGLDANPAPTTWLTEREPAFEPVASALRGFRAPCFPTLFETICRVLPFQQLSLDAGTAIVSRFVERFGAELSANGRSLFAFPDPETIAQAPIEALREVGLSRPKATALRSLAMRALAGELEVAHFQTRSTEDALKELNALPGVGPWTAGVILLRGLRRMEVFPTGDVGAARSLPALLGLSARWSPAEASEYAAQFGDRRCYLYFLGLGAQLLTRGLLEPATD